MVPVGLDGLVTSLKDDVDLVDGVELVVEAVLADQDDDEADILKRPNQRPKNEPDGYTAPIRVRNGSF